MAIDLTPTRAMAEAAALGLELRRKQPKSRQGGTAVGVARARDISNRKTLSESTIGRMVSYFARHSVDVGKPGWGSRTKPSKGWQAWLLWGGNPGRTWANAKWKAIQREREKGALLRAANARTPSQRRRTHRQWVRNVQGPMERLFAREFRAFFKGQSKRIVERFGAWAETNGYKAIIGAIGRDFTISVLDIEDIVSATLEAAKMASEVGSDLLTQAVLRGWADGLDQMASEDLTWDPRWNPAPRFFGQLVTFVTQSTKDNVEAIILEGAREGKTIAEVQLDLMRAEAFSPMRALRIARTESARGLNAGALLAYNRASETGVNVRIEWLSAMDRATRESHLLLDGKVVAPGESFVVGIGENVGARAPCPGQFHIPSEDINCRCTVSPVVEGWDD